MYNTVEFFLIGLPCSSISGLNQLFINAKSSNKVMILIGIFFTKALPPAPPARSDPREREVDLSPQGAEHLVRQRERRRERLEGAGGRHRLSRECEIPARVPLSQCGVDPRDEERPAAHESRRGERRPRARALLRRRQMIGDRDRRDGAGRLVRETEEQRLGAVRGRGPRHRILARELPRGDGAPLTTERERGDEIAVLLLRGVEVWLERRPPARLPERVRRGPFQSDRRT